MSLGLIDSYDGVLFDLDGVLYAGPSAIPGAARAVDELVRRGIPRGYVTNNASRSAEQVAAHLNELGIPALTEEVVGSAPAGVTLLGAALEPGAKVLVTGSEYLRNLVGEAGFTVVDSAAEKPAAVIQGFDPGLCWADLAEAAYAVNDGAQWFATNLDLSIPRERGIAPGNGALVEAVGRATGKTPTAAGKPEPVMFTQAANTLQIQRPLVIGDRLDTDVLGGNRAGFDTALVLTGIDTAASAEQAQDGMRPDWILTDLAQIFDGTHRALQERVGA
ncbi:HAD-IIA family hydrolase [Nesterenkonia sp. LB17]|uniref:HAD-IIA family hydrolase n=1 Tax=unclassified Nesterenkonia TaxID=2629769 RepID=UPI001F4C9B3C|nr:MULTISPECIES: HAD-IIA family hydrolase [unclassified Nesterenkonia]MCH8561076.1 HAD-IIA family hydrolase [Nesterenkonia sp. DZ6]MCH8562622.1 HAD-IIA family hydrolase [Nesterenkonia sp. YGD6]MCH8565544.1 HAD-IIA family hydrolase [Nesterenkonia sp. LB17]MCH8572119.1 HAD-IIA family hydrolase [Nesterenkonia sp. AY15]